MFKQKRKPSITSQDLLIPALDADYWSLKLPDYNLGFAFLCYCMNEVVQPDI